jgi:hypothetical protein
MMTGPRMAPEHCAARVALLRSAAAGPVAQWSELAAHNRSVGGSSPPGPTTPGVSYPDIERTPRFQFKNAPIFTIRTPRSS